ncbi:isoprenylcysteine carboxylmethyltransferase family protein [Hyphomicrobium sp. CS1GBMeth3]|uniref:methyltransferase family protein n=1 Tax=Hyphomicrobium sp. CS1GBMeth3 TaxID=1892845 RepID=UPI00093087B6|nr:isoprenylcysteine carboxylmethyltransferase family protein [Hyphomicrobium sp. CS1GBMeth3]
MGFELQLVFLIGLVAASALIALLAMSSHSSAVSIWPCPDHRSWQALTFWALFRIANVATLIVIAGTWTPGVTESVPRLIATGVGAICFIFYAMGCVQLGRRNLYGATEGLNTDGIYRWSRNPQYATAMPGYVALAVGAASAPALCLAALVGVIFWQMATLEERWLLAAYGDAYDHYRSRVPRFYNVERARVALRRMANTARSKAEAVIRQR